MENRIAPVGVNISMIRERISDLELCHHKAERWVYNIIQAIGTGKTTKGLGTRATGKEHPREAVWRNACAALSAWCAGCPASSRSAARCQPASTLEGFAASAAS